FVLSAFESRDDEVLCILDKGHDAAGEAAALRIVRSAGIELRPSWLPFTPWTTRRSIAELLTFSAEHDLIWSTDAVQYSIRLLLPVGSLLLESPDPALATSLGRLDAASGSVPWRSTDSLLDALQEDLAGLAETALAESLSPEESFGAIWRAARRRGIELPPEVPAVRFHAVMPGPERPHLSESWFCCAEPTGAQRVAVGLPAP
ncbi:MAG: CUAEP/CCAEP-tail radical SAM (seleno)protein, partial [Acidimicrobiales bacterium]